MPLFPFVSLLVLLSYVYAAECVIIGMCCFRAIRVHIYIAECNKL